MDYAFKLTTNGRSLIAACGALEKPLRVSRVAVGSGQVPEETDLADVHELYHYVADGSIGERRHENDRLYLTIQYANSEHKEQPTFFLSEFLVYAQHPESGEETDLLYATLGDYQQPVPAYRPELPGSIFNFPLVIVVSDEIQVEITAAPGLVSHDDLQRLMNEGVIGISRSEITIPANGWTDSREDAADGVGGDPAFGNYPFHVDVSVTGTKSRMTPIVTIYPQHLSIARITGFSFPSPTPSISAGRRTRTRTPPRAISLCLTAMATRWTAARSLPTLLPLIPMTRSSMRVTSPIIRSRRSTSFWPPRSNPQSRR